MALTSASHSVWQRAILMLFHLPSKTAVYVCSGLFLLIAIADLVTPPELNLSLFYVFVILLATWNAGLATGVAFALASALMQWIVLSELSAPTLHSIYWYFWLANRWFTFFVVVALTHPLRLTFERHRIAARIDSLTGAANKAYFHEMLRIAIDRSNRYGEPFAVAFMDCDDFKLVNDQFGHIAGDSVLRAVVETAKAHSRISDTVARLGGDEFAILLPTATNKNAREILGRLRARLTDQNFGRQWSATLSIGLATFERTRLSPDEVMAQCDSLMYRAKRNGKGQIVSEHFPASSAHKNDLALSAMRNRLPDGN